MERNDVQADGQAEAASSEPFVDLMEQITGWEEELEDDSLGAAMYVTKLKLDLPVEFRVTADATGRVAIATSAPRQSFETGVMPVFHHMQLHLTVDDGS